MQARCHGAVDEMRVDLRRMSTADIASLNAAQEGVAFTNPLLPA